jgi:TRAP-type C4-dicarboxylate transport system substrate-binding protein
MKRARLFFWILLSAVIGLTVAVPATSLAQKKPIVLRLVVPTPPNDYPLGTALENMAQKFNERVMGEYKIEVYPGGALVKMPQYFDAVGMGVVEMVSVAWTVFSFQESRLGIIETPYLFASNRAAQYATRGILPLYDQILQEKFNAKALGLVALTASELITSEPVKKLEDVKGMRIGAVSPVSGAMVKDLGGSPVTIMWPDLYESLRKNVVTGTMSHVHAAMVMNFFGVCKYATLSFGPASFQGICINLDMWKKMSPRVRSILQEEVDASNAWLGKTFVKLAQDEMKELKGKKGVFFYWLPAAERQRWIEATAAYREKQMVSFGDFGVKIRKIAEEANKRFPYEEGHF